MAVQFLILTIVVFQTGQLIYYDELLHAVAAQRMLKEDCADIEDNRMKNCYVAATHEVLGQAFLGHRVPLFILYYVGGVKTYLLSGWFLVFGSSLTSLRLFTALCGAIVAGLTYYFVHQNFSQRAAWITSALLLLDPTFVLSRILDWGPVSTQDLWKIVLLIVVYRLMKEHTTRLLLLAGLICGILLWDKLNAWWLVLPLGLVVGKKYFRRIGLFLAGFMIGVLPVVLLIWKRPWFYGESLKSFRAFEQYALRHQDNPLLWNLLSNYLSDWSIRTARLWEVLSGVAIPNYILNAPISMFSSFSILLIVALGIVVVRSLIKRQKFELEFAGIIGLMFVMVIFIFATPHANAIHHYLIIYPLAHLTVGVLLATYWSGHRILVSILLCVVVISNALVLYQFIMRSKDPTAVHIYWQTDQVQKTTDLLERMHPDTRIAALDWGISLPVAFGSNGNVAIEDVQPFYDPRCQEVAKKIVNGYVFVRYEKEWVFETYDTECRQFPQIIAF